MGVALGPKDIAFRCNLVTVAGSGSEATMEDFTSGHISTDEAAEIIRDLDSELGGDGIEFFPGVSYRHLMVWRDGMEKMTTTPPHDITDQKTAGYHAQWRRRRAFAQVDGGVATSARKTSGKLRNARPRPPPSDDHLAMGPGRAPQLPPLTERFGITGGVISAVDIIHGLGVYAGLGAHRCARHYRISRYQLYRQGRIRRALAGEKRFCVYPCRGHRRGRPHGRLSRRRFKRWKISTRKLSARC